MSAVTPQQLISEFTVDFAGSKYPCFYAETREFAEHIIDFLLKKDGVLAADTETAPFPQFRHIPGAALDPHLSHPRLVQMFTGTGAVVIDLWKTGPINLKRLFESRPSVFHNMTFDYKMLRQHYDVVDADMHCTCIMARCVWHALFAEDKSAALDSVVLELFGQLLIKKGGRSDWSVPTLTFEQIEYAAKDAICEMRIYEKLTEYIDKLQLRKVYDLYRRSQKILCEMELNGINIDKPRHIQNVVKWREDLKDAIDTVKEVADLGEDKITDARIAKHLQNTLPEKIVMVWPRTDTGKLKTDSETLMNFSHLPIVAPFSRYQKLKKLTTSFGMNLIHMINPATGKLHPTYRVAGARTGRLSCTEPNIQQQPRSKDMRSVYIPSEGYVMVVADYSQVEVRCIAEYANDENMIKAYREGLDMYSYTASELTGIPYEVINSKDENGNKHPARQQAKALVLGLNYGLGAPGFKKYAKKGYDVDLTDAESREIVKKYRGLYSRLREWQMEQVAACEARRYTVFTRMGKSRKLTEENYFCACMNHPIQGSCAEIMLLAICYTHEFLKGTSARLLASVHDEILLECLPQDVDTVKEKLAKAMVKAYLEILPSGRTINKVCEPSSGLTWADAKE